ncbi:MAG: hypothetical protein A3F72_08535 [Bacteroidetes bacterium RIFCSPLOWO2_12_FULL_35_15]|nr:MAG: hypothetical protein A3F72_08535 [Bacteroidetes bacterium RIFCSPLOWO2_12_FULL_35_15]
MKSLFNTQHNQEIIDRINSLTPESRAQWGKMNVAQMFVHNQVGLKGAFGEMKFKRGLIALLFGKMAKKVLTNEKHFKHNLPTDKAFLITEQKQFKEEQQKLIQLVTRFSNDGPKGLTQEPHPFFGKLTSEEWDILQWKHMDHHLRQFGV